MSRNRPRWHHAALGAIAVVVAVVGLGLILEHTVGPGWGGNPLAGPKPGLIHVADHSTSQRIRPAIKAELLKGPRLGARFGGTNFSNIGGLDKAVFVQLGIGTAVVLLTIAWRRLRRQRHRLS